MSSAILDIKQLKHFIHLSSTLHFGKSAQALHINASTLSRSISRLEESVGLPLFERDNRSVKLNSAGLQFRSYAQLTLDNWDNIRIELKNKSGQLAGHLRIFCSVTASYSHLPSVLDKFRLQYPEVEIELSTGDSALALDKVANKEADISLAAKPDKLASRFDFISLGKIPLAIIAPKVNCQVQQLISQKHINWQQVPFILPEHGPARRRINRWFKQMGISSPNIFATVAGHEAIVSMVALGSGVGIAPELVVETSPVRERVQPLSKVSDIEPFDLGFCILKKRMNEATLHAFWQQLSME